MNAGSSPVLNELLDLPIIDINSIDIKLCGLISHHIFLCLYFGTSLSLRCCANNIMNDHDSSLGSWFLVVGL